MRRVCRAAVLLWASFVVSAVTTAQEGHPLVGSWHGDWALGDASRRDLTLVVDYTADGADVAGIANPGYDHASLQNLRVTIPKPTDWNVRFEVELKDKAGKATRYVAEGTLAKIGSDRRTLIGAWSAGSAKGDFRLTRDRDYSR
jgi:hypothetical protein